MERITPHLWFDKEAREAGAFYVSLFEDACVKKSMRSGTSSRTAALRSWTSVPKFDLAKLREAAAGAA